MQNVSHKISYMLTKSSLYMHGRPTFFPGVGKLGGLETKVPLGSEGGAPVGVWKFSTKN